MISYNAIRKNKTLSQVLDVADANLAKEGKTTTAAAEDKKE